MLSFCCALNDLTQLHKELIKIYKNRNYDLAYKKYLFRMSIPQLREVYWLIEQSFANENIKQKLCQIGRVEELYKKIVERVEGNDEENFAFKVLKPFRNMSYHYGFKKDKGKSIVTQVINEMHDEQTVGKIIGKKKSDRYYEFADDIVLSAIFTFGEQYGLSENEMIEKMGFLIAEIMELLDVIVEDFLMKNELIIDD